MVWLVVWPLAINAITKTQIQWDDSGHVLTFSDSRCAPHDIQLGDLRALAHSLVTDAQKNLEEQLPQDILLSELLKAVDLKQLKDKPDSQTSFLQQNKKIFEPLIKEVFQSLTSRTEVKHSLMNRKKDAKNIYHSLRLKTWFGKEQALLRSILCTYFFTCGIPPRGFQAAELRLASSKKGKRNVYMMKGRLIFGWPRSKAFSQAVQAALWSLPPVLGQIITLYLGVL